MWIPSLQHVEPWVPVGRRGSWRWSRAPMESPYWRTAPNNHGTVQNSSENIQAKFQVLRILLRLNSQDSQRRGRSFWVILGTPESDERHASGLSSGRTRDTTQSRQRRTRLDDLVLEAGKHEDGRRRKEREEQVGSVPVNRSLHISTAHAKHPSIGTAAGHMHAAGPRLS